jgi:hypothetical protein
VVSRLGYPSHWKVLLGGFRVVIFIVITCIVCVAAFVALNPDVLEQIKTSSPSRLRDQVPASLENQKTKLQQSFSYSLKKTLFTPAEILFYQALERSIREEYLIFSKVRVADILEPQSISDRSTWQHAFNKISAKHFDFVLCDKNNFEVRCVIELDDSSHRQKKRITRDIFLNNAAQSAGLELVL